MEQYGVDPDESATVTDEDYQVHIDPPTFTLTKEQRMQLLDPFKMTTIKVGTITFTVQTRKSSVQFTY